MSNEDIVIGIDFGTTNSAACIYRNGKPEIIPNPLGYDYFPSVVAVNENGDLLIGQYAKKPALLPVHFTISSPARRSFLKHWLNPCWAAFNGCIRTSSHRNWRIRAEA